MKAIFSTSKDSDFVDNIADRFRFIKKFKPIVEKAKDDWIIYYQSAAAGGAKGYIAAAGIKDIVPDIGPDPTKPGDWYAAILEKKNFWEFVNPVPLYNGTRYIEDKLNKIPKKSLGWYMLVHRIRPISDSEFCEIILKGLPNPPKMPLRTVWEQCKKT